jgi:rod shape-determining protein MreB
MAAGARQVYMVPEPSAAAIGAGLPVNGIIGTMIVDIGGGTTEVAAVAVGGIVVSRSLRVAGDELDQDIINYVRNKYNLFIGERMAEKVKIAIGSAFPMKEERTIDVRGRNLVTGLPEAIEISSVEIREAMSGSIGVIVKTIRDALDEAPPEILSDLIDNGICLAGGSSQLTNLAERLSADLRVRVWVAEDPMTCVARGCGIILENIDEYSSFLVGLEREPVKRTLS